ncbi:Acylphosphatase [Hexamita inflata]|uniref:Acylphosphatase n=1 Tax=Hexamita inflata TaxID=28002 RepID=A0AA86QDK3_9EUKA|nr:Acylphosphatase [Hexamita inflata]
MVCIRGIVVIAFNRQQFDEKYRYITQCTNCQFCPLQTQLYSFIVTGKVQGVFFRKYTEKAALQYQICGWVRNNPDGTVSGEAYGTVENLKLFNAFLHKGSPKSKVSSVKWELSKENKQFNKFEIDK